MNARRVVRMIRFIPLVPTGRYAQAPGAMQGPYPLIAQKSVAFGTAGGAIKAGHSGRKVTHRWHTGFPMTGTLYRHLVGQEQAVASLRAAARRPVHAYLFVGPPGAGKAAAASSFAAFLLCPATFAVPPGPPDGTCETCRRVLGGVHPDVVHVERVGASIDIGTARQVIRAAVTSPVEGDRKVLILHDFHLVSHTGPALLKTIEEPPPTTIFVILAEYLPPELVTIASRCVRVDFVPLPRPRSPKPSKPTGWMATGRRSWPRRPGGGWTGPACSHRTASSKLVAWPGVRSPPGWTAPARP